MATPNLSLIDGALENYRSYLEESKGKRADVTFKDPVADFTGGGITFEGTMAICEYLAQAEAIEKGLYGQETWVGPWQPRMIEEIFEYSRVVLQGPRQETGKSFTLSRVAAAYIAAGLPVIIAMPTLTQGARILFRNIDRNLKRIERAFPGYVRVVDNTSEILYNNGGQLLVLSSDAGAEKEGYTCALLIMDESHKSNRSTFAVFEPFVSKARQAGYGRVVLLGIGGHKNSLIEEQKNHGYHTTRITIEEMVTARPELKALFDSYKESLTAHDYRTMYECLPALAGTRLAYPVVPGEPLVFYNGGAPYRRNGIDVGRTSDLTVLASILHKQGGAVADKFQEIDPVDFGSQAVQIKGFLDRWEGVQWDRSSGSILDTNIEINGIGRGLYDIMQFGLPPKTAPILPGVTGVHLDYDMKEALVDETSKMFQTGQLAVSDPDVRHELEGIGFELKWDDKKGQSRRVWDHSDNNSALIQAVGTIMRVGGAM